MKLGEEAIQHLEEHMPELFAAAVTQAYWAALADGHNVVQREGDDLVEVSPDGTRRVIKPLPPMVSVEPGRLHKLL
jgi:hypothetical protein